MSIAGGSAQERKIAVELRLDPVNPCGDALGAKYKGEKYRRNYKTYLVRPCMDYTWFPLTRLHPFLFCTYKITI